MLTAGVSVTQVATAVGVTPYVVQVIRDDPGPRNHRGPRRRATGRRVPNRQHGIDPSVIRMIARMLAAGTLPQMEIARCAGVSPGTVAAVARGKRPPACLRRPVLDDGETFLPEPVRCPQCGAAIVVVPCRACRARQERARRFHAANSLL